MRAPSLPSPTRWVAFAVWAAVAGCAAFWGSKLLVRATPVPATATAVPGLQVLRGDVSRLLGEAEVDLADAAPAAAPSRFKLVGVVAPRAPQAAAEGVAVIVVDDRPPRAYRVGATVDGALVLQRVHAKGADLGARDAAQASVTLAVSPLPPAATGTPAALRPGVALAPGAALPRPMAPRPMGGQPVAPADPGGEPDDPPEVEPLPNPTVRTGQMLQ